MRQVFYVQKQRCPGRRPRRPAGEASVEHRSGVSSERNEQRTGDRNEASGDGSTDALALSAAPFS